MRDNPIHNIIQFLTGGIPDQMALGEYRWLTVALYWALLLGGLAIAAYNWRRDPLQRTGYHVGLFLTRMVSANIWFLGSLWKLPLPVSGGFQSWTDQTVKYSAFQWHADFMQFFADHIAVVGPLVYMLEVSLAASLMLGFMVRISGLVAALFTFNLLIGLYNAPTEWVWTYVGIIFTHTLLATTQAGRSLGADNLVARGFVAKWLLASPTGSSSVARAFRWACSAA